MHVPRSILLMLLLSGAPALAQDDGDDGGLPTIDEGDGGFTRDDVVQSCDCATAGGAGWILAGLIFGAAALRRRSR